MTGPKTPGGLIYRLLTSVKSIVGAIITMTFQMQLFVLGKAYSFEDYFVFAADEVVNIVVDPLLYKGLNLVVNPIAFSASAGPVTIDFYAGTDADADGTELEASNRRSTMLTLPKTVLRKNPTINNIGTRFAGDLVPSTGTAAANSTGATNARDLPFEISNKTKYTIKLTNTNGNDVYVGFKMTWFET